MGIPMSDQEPGTPQEPIDVHTVLMIMLEQMASIAWQKLGLQPDMATGKVVADLPQAKVAIDVTAHLATTLEPKLDEDDRRQLQNLVRDLRVNFVEKSKEATS
jgi:hypothetical protein